MSNRVLLIGGGGYIGSHLVPVLLNSGREVTVLGRGEAPRHLLAQGARYVCGDFSHQPLLNTLLEDHAEIVHLAYASVPNTSYDNPLADLLENLSPTVQMFSAIAEIGRRLVLVSSGGTVYGEARSLPIAEHHPTEPISPYGVTKLTLEKYAHLFSVTHGLDVVCVRPANAYGEGQRPFTGQGFIATAMAAAMKNEPVLIFGKEGTVRDYLHVDDIASGILAALDHGKSGSIFNLGSGVGLSNVQVVEAMKPLLREVGFEVRTTHAPARPFDVQANVLDSRQLKDLTGWRPSIEFADGLRRTRDWLLRQHG